MECPLGRAGVQIECLSGFVGEGGRKKRGRGKEKTSFDGRFMIAANKETKSSGSGASKRGKNR